jgi:hypothetical protein
VTNNNPNKIAMTAEALTQRGIDVFGAGSGLPIKISYR